MVIGLDVLLFLCRLIGMGVLLILGAIDVASHATETPEEVAATLRQALQFVDADKLYPCANSGMAPLPREVIQGKLRALQAGVELVRRELRGAAE